MERKHCTDILYYRMKERNRICSQISNLNTKEKSLKRECETLEKQYLKDSKDIRDAARACWGPQVASRVSMLLEHYSQDQAAIGCIPDLEGIITAKQKHLNSDSDGGQIPTTTTSHEDCSMQAAADDAAAAAHRNTSSSTQLQNDDATCSKQQPDGLICKEQLLDSKEEGQCKKRISLRNDKKSPRSSRTCGSGGASAFVSSHMTLSEKLNAVADVQQYSQIFPHSKRNCKNRVRFLLAEECRAADHSEPFIDCQAIHNTPQRFPTNVSVVAIQAEINRILTELLLEKEEMFMSSRLSNSNLQSETTVACEDSSSEDSGIESSSETDIDFSKNDEASTTVLPDQQQQQQQQHGGTIIDEWKPYADVPLILERQEQLHKEINRLQNLCIISSPDQKNNQEETASERTDQVDVKMALSVLRGGNPRMKIADAIKEMRWEHAELQRYIYMCSRRVLSTFGVLRRVNNTTTTSDMYSYLKQIVSFVTFFDQIPQ